MAELGTPYLYFAIQVLQNACPAKGYTAHVLGYTLHALLEALSKVQPCAALILTGLETICCKIDFKACYSALLCIHVIHSLKTHAR